MIDTYAALIELLAEIVLEYQDDQAQATSEIVDASL